MVDLADERLTEVLASMKAPADRPIERLDVRDLPPPEPLTETIERLESLPAETVLVQTNDRVPRHLFSRLENRGYRHATAEADGVVLTAIWDGETAD